MMDLDFKKIVSHVSVVREFTIGVTIARFFLVLSFSCITLSCSSIDLQSVLHYKTELDLFDRSQVVEKRIIEERSRAVLDSSHESIVSYQRSIAPAQESMESYNALNKIDVE